MEMETLLEAQLVGLAVVSWISEPNQQEEMEIPLCDHLDCLLTCKS